LAVLRDPLHHVIVQDQPSRPVDLIKHANVFTVLLVKDVVLVLNFLIFELSSQLLFVATETHDQVGLSGLGSNLVFQLHSHHRCPVGKEN
jgi:hypothetical protein